MLYHVMRKLWKYCMLFGVLAPNYLSAQTGSLPYAQDFENFSACIADCRFQCSLSEQWQNGTGDDTDWSVWLGRTSTPNTGPAQDFQPGTSWGKYLYLEASNGCESQAQAHLISPAFDFLGTSLPTLSFAYHMHGLGQGSLHIDIDSSGVWEEDVFPPIYSNENRWQLAQYCIPWLVDKADVRFRIRGITGRSETSDMAIDAFKVYDAHVHDPAITKVLKNGCGLGSLETISFVYANFGASSLPALQASFAIDNGPFSSPETISANLASCATDIFTFVQTADLSAPGNHRITVALHRLQQDPNHANDTLSIFVETIPKIDKFPYEESFEHDKGRWELSGDYASWQWGVPTGNWIKNASHGKKAWFTANSQGTYNNKEFSFLTSPCFDFTAFTVDPILVFDHTYQLERLLDSSWLEYSVDGGANWLKMKQAFSPLANWYNFPLHQVWSGNAPAGSGNWQTAAVRLDGLAGESVRFRFVMFSDGSIRQEGIGVDRVRIMLPYDVAVTAIETPYDTCGGFWGKQEPVRVRVRNKGYFGLPNLKISYYLSGSAGFITPETIPGTLAPGDSTTFTFQKTADLSVLGKHFITVTALLVTDGLPQDNSLNRSTSNFPWADVRLSPDTVICKGDLVKIKAFAPEADSFLWSDGSHGHAILTGKRGFHSLKVIDQNGCPGSDSMLLDLLPQPQVRVNFMEPVRCYGDSTGILDLHVFGSVPPYDFSWDDGGTLLRRTGLPANFYPFLVTDQYGCRLRDSIEIKQNDSLEIILGSIHHSGCPMDSSGLIDISVKGGQPPYSYFWSNGNQSEDLTRILDGNYSVLISDIYGCSTFSENFSVATEDTLPKAHFSYRISGGTVVIIDSSTNTVYQTYSFGDGSEPVEGTNPQYTYAENGLYKVKLVAENSCGRDTFVIEILVNAVKNDNPELESVIRIGPNPVTESYFYIHFQNTYLEDVKMNVYDLSGKLCLMQDLQSVFQTTSRRVNIPENLANGYYLVEVSTHKGRLRQKLLLKR